MNDFGFGTDDYGSVWVVLAFRSDVVHVMEESLLYDFSRCNMPVPKWHYSQLYQ